NFPAQTKNAVIVFIKCRRFTEIIQNSKNRLSAYFCTMVATTLKKDIRNIEFPELETFLKASGEPAFRARQIWEWLWKKGARSFETMTNLSKSLREKLAEHFSFPVLSEDKIQLSA